MRAFVTGVGGFVGAHLATRLVDDGWDVVGTVRPRGHGVRATQAGHGVRATQAGHGVRATQAGHGVRATQAGHGVRATQAGHGVRATQAAALTRPLPASVEVVAADLADREQAVAAARAADADVAFLLAAARADATAAERAATVAVNSTSVQWLVDALPSRCRTVVRLGSSTEYGVAGGPMDESVPLRPRGFFGATKAAGSLLLAAACVAGGRRAVVLRAFQVYGPLDHPGRLVPRALRSARTGEPLPLTVLGQRRDWVFVDDVVRACILAAAGDHLPPGQVLNIGTGHQVANEELVAAVERVTGRRIVVAPGTHPGREWDTASWVCDPSRARALLGWHALVDLDEGLRRCWEAA